MKDKMISVSDKVLTVVVVVIIMIGLFSIVVRMGTRLLVKRGICNETIAKVIFFDNKSLAGIDEDNLIKQLKSVDWKSLYQFNAETKTYFSKVSRINFQIPKIKSIINMIETWINDEFAFRNFFIDSTNVLRRILVTFSFDGVILSFDDTYKLMNGHFTTFVSKKEDVYQKANAIIDFSKHLDSLGTPFLYVQAPFKIDSKDTLISGKLDYSNQNTDDFLALIDDAGIDFIDMRDEIKKVGLNHYDCFYKTDHHWKAETGLWAAEIIVKKMNENFSLGIDETVVSSENFNYEILHDSFLGSHGRKVTLVNSAMEDITLITPRKEYTLEAEFYSQTALLRKATGGFDVLLFPEHIQTKENAYSQNAYAMYMKGDTNAMIKNYSAQNNLRILFLGDSFSDVVKPFMALCVKEFDTLDLRHFDGSLTSWLEQNEKYDAVIMLLNASKTAGEIDYSDHTDLWDFR